MHMALAPAGDTACACVVCCIPLARDAVILSAPLLRHTSSEVLSQTVSS